MLFGNSKSYFQWNNQNLMFRIPVRTKNFATSGMLSQSLKTVFKIMHTHLFQERNIIYKMFEHDLSSINSLLFQLIANKGSSSLSIHHKIHRILKQVKENLLKSKNLKFLQGYTVCFVLFCLFPLISSPEDLGKPQYYKVKIHTHTHAPQRKKPINK